MYKLLVYNEGCLMEGWSEDGFETRKEAEDTFFDMLPWWCDNGGEEPIDKDNITYKIVEE